MNEKADSGIDILKVYIWGMASLSMITFAWLIINYLLLLEYRSELESGKEEMENIIKQEMDLPAREEVKQGEIQSAFAFFTRTVRGLPETPRVEIGKWEQEHFAYMDFEEKKYSIFFERGMISRYHLARYIHTIQKERKSLKVKKLDLTKVGHPSEDRWIAEIVFAQRRALAE